MVYRDHWALGQWYRHYAGHLGAENLFVVAHGADPTLAQICPKASIITIPRERFDGFDAVRGQVLNGIQKGLSEIYDWVIRTDADELICLDPERHGGFADLLGQQDGDAVFALGLNVAERDGDATLPADASVFSARKTAILSGHYSKAWAVRRGLPLVRHGVAMRKRLLPDAPFSLPPGTYLAHLKFANRSALEDANRHRREVANSQGRGLPGNAWKKPVLEARKFYRNLDALRHRDWPEAEAEARAEIIADPVRDESKGILRARNIRFGFRTTLPDWFGRI